MEFLSTYLVAVVSLAILVFILLMWREDRHQMAQERKDLYDRLMSRSIVEYKENVNPEPNELPQENPDIVDIDSDEAREELVSDYSPYQGEEHLDG